MHVDAEVVRIIAEHMEYTRQEAWKRVEMGQPPGVILGAVLQSLERHINDLKEQTQ